MALNFTVSYSFSPSTTISSSQVNTNTSDVANVFTGLEAETKTLAKLKVDIDPTLALEVATKQYVDHYSTYRRPVLQYQSGTVANLETGINGTSGQAQILFPDGNLRTDSTATRINVDVTRVAAISGTAQSGIQTGTVTNNTWMAVYAVKTSDNASNFVLVADAINFPSQSKFSTLNINFGANSWVYLGYIRYGDTSGTANAIIKFRQSGNQTRFYNTTVGNAFTGSGIRFGTTASATNIITNPTSGMTVADYPPTALLHYYLVAATNGTGGDTTTVSAADTTQIFNKNYALSGNCFFQVGPIEATQGIKTTMPGAGQIDHFFVGYADSVLGVGSNPIL